MKPHSISQRYITFVCSCAFIFILAGGQAEGARRSRVLSTALFASGMSLHVGSSFLKAAAQDRYDAYLNAAIQADIETHKDAFLVRRNAGTLMSRVGLGCVGLAVLLSIYNQLNTPEPIDETVSAADRSKTHVRGQPTRLSNLTHRFSQNTGLLFPRPRLQLHPYYDFHTHRASLRLLHHF